VGAEIDADEVSKLIAASALSTGDRGHFDTELLRQCTLAGGDDYELAFTAPPARREAVARAAAAAATPVARIGRIRAEPGLRLVDAQGRALAGRYASFDHFAG
jgi:thiamine-monophosphate kinase